MRKLLKELFTFASFKSIKQKYSRDMSLPVTEITHLYQDKQDKQHFHAQVSK